MMQFEDLGFCEKGEGSAFVRAHGMTLDGSFPNNTSGGQLSVGQAGAAGGFLGMTEAIRQLTGQAGARAVPDAQTGPGRRLRHGHLRPLPVHRRGASSGDRHDDAPDAPQAQESGPAHAADEPAAVARAAASALGLTAAAAEGRFELQECQDCGTVQYPPREACHKCLSAALRWREQSGEGNAARHDHAAPQQRPVLPRAPALAPRPGAAGRRPDADGAPARRGGRRARRACAWARGSTAPARRY